MNKIKRLLITGGAGFIGINLVDYLLKTAQYKITVVDNLSAGNLQLLREIVNKRGGEIEEFNFASPQKKLNPAGVRFIREDILNRQNILKTLEGQDQVVHLAAQTGVIPSLENPSHDAAVNITGTMNLLEAAVKQGVGKFLFASSAAPLGEQDPPLHEGKVPKPLAPYGASKLAGEAYCSAYHGSFGLDTTVMRFSNVYGPNSFHKGSVVALFIKKILAGETLTIYGDGLQTRDFLYVGDIVRIIHKLLQNREKKIAGQLFQLGTGVETSVNQLVDSLEKISGRSLKVNRQPERKGEIKRNYTAIDKIKNTLGYQPQFHLEKGLEITWKWFKG
ncbi:MAG: NAD-dependent epimerase/dehydratase family protein [bacterium]|nr:NAD-dependent epimerase/dehydratase family protein [bacterium]